MYKLRETAIDTDMRTVVNCEGVDRRRGKLWIRAEFEPLALVSRCRCRLVSFSLLAMPYATRVAHRSSTKTAEMPARARRNPTTHRFRTQRTAQSDAPPPPAPRPQEKSPRKTPHVTNTVSPRVVLRGTLVTPRPFPQSRLCHDSLVPASDGDMTYR